MQVLTGVSYNRGSCFRLSIAAVGRSQSFFDPKARRLRTGSAVCTAYFEGRGWHGFDFLAWVRPALGWVGWLTGREWPTTARVQGKGRRKGGEGRGALSLSLSLLCARHFAIFSLSLPLSASLRPVISRRLQVLQDRSLTCGQNLDRLSCAKAKRTQPTLTFTSKTSLLSTPALLSLHTPLQASRHCQSTFSLQRICVRTPTPLVADSVTPAAPI